MRQWFRQHAKVWFVTLLCVVIAWATTKLLTRIGALRVPTFMVYDAMVRHRANTTAATPTPAAPATCVIVGLEDSDIQEMGSYPVSDFMMAELLDKILLQHPAAVGLDIYRDLTQGDARRPGQADADHRRLEQIFLDHDNVVVPQLIGKDANGEVSPPKVLENSPFQVGINDIKTDTDDVLRRAILVEGDRHRHFRYSLAALLAARAIPDGAAYAESDDNLHFACGQILYPRFKLTDGPYINAHEDSPHSFQILVDFRAPREFPEISALKVIKNGAPADLFSGKVVLIGLKTDSVKDFVNTPIGNHRLGVEFHATVVDQLVRASRAAGLPSDSGAPLREWSVGQQNAWIILFCLLGTSIAWGVRPPGRYLAGVLGVTMVGVAAAAVLAGLALIVVGAFQENLWIPFVTPLLGFSLGAGLVTVYSSVSGRLDRRAMMKLFSWCVAEDVAKEIWKHRESIFTHGQLMPRRMRATLLFTDLVGFSKRAEGAEPEVVMKWLKQYFEEIAGMVNLENGNINKFNGDQIVAVFGPPVEHDEQEAAEDARNAVSCALRMRDKLIELNQNRQSGTPETHMRVGIHSGWVVAGSLGTRGRLEWTVIGSDVNIAARLESTTKEKMGEKFAPGGCRILISQITRNLMADAFPTELFGELRLDGISAPVSAYTVSRTIPEENIPPHTVPFNRQPQAASMESS